MIKKIVPAVSLMTLTACSSADWKTEAVSTPSSERKTEAVSTPPPERKTYESASGIKTFRFMSGDTETLPARLVVVRDQTGVKKVFIGAEQGSNWSIHKCELDGGYSEIRYITPEGRKFDGDGIEGNEYCRIDYDKKGNVESVAITDEKTKKSAKGAFASCPAGRECEFYKVNTKWFPSNGDLPGPSEQNMGELQQGQRDANNYVRKQDAIRSEAEDRMNRLIKDCREGSQYACDAVKAITQ